MPSPSNMNAANMDTAADGNTLAVPQVIIRKDIADASADIDIVLAANSPKLRVIGFKFLNTGAAAHATADTVQLKNLTNAITDAVAKTATVNAVVKAATINPAYHEVSPGGTLRITAVHNTNVAGTAYIECIPVP